LPDLREKLADGCRRRFVFENVREDWRTHERKWSRHGFWILLIYRFGRWRYGIRLRVVRVPFSFLYKLLKFFSEMLLGMELPCEAVIGRRFVIEHIGGIVVSGDAVFGDDCIIRNGVTVGLRNRGIRGSPRIGNRVDIGTGAKLIGPIHIGDDVAIGANAVVLCDVPANSIAVGVPAHIRPRKIKTVSEDLQERTEGSLSGVSGREPR
jgi:serine O-acetyltransferase